MWIDIILFLCLCFPLIAIFLLVQKIWHLEEDLKWEKEFNQYLIDINESQRRILHYNGLS